MQVFLIHRFIDKAAALRLIRKISKKQKIPLVPYVMNSSGGDGWKETARNEIGRSEAAIVFNKKACSESENATWEITVAKELGKPLVFLDYSNPDKKELDTLCAVYHFDQEFESFFKKPDRPRFSKQNEGGNDKNKDFIELYKVMVASSEQLIQRRQSMNAFFIAAIGSLLAFAGALVKFGNVESKTLSFIVISLLAVTGLILCHSWHNLIDNYGKLNKAKFRVITKLEESLSAQIFSAEWAALGKGSRPDKYRSFTSTEKNVPNGFAALIFILLFLSVGWYLCSDSDAEKPSGNLPSTQVCSDSSTFQKSNELRPAHVHSRKPKICPPAKDRKNSTQADQVGNK